jgi:hypothetical protein
MGTLMRRADGLPVAFVAGSEEPVELHRVSPNDPKVAESEIQRLVSGHPQVLPIEEADELLRQSLETRLPGTGTDRPWCPGAANGKPGSSRF